MTTSKRILEPLLALLASSVLATVAVWLWLRGSSTAGEGESTALVDMREQVESLLAEHASPVPLEPDDGPATLVRGPLPREVAVKLFGQLTSGDFVEDPNCYYRPKGPMTRKRTMAEHPGGMWVVHNNSLGLRDSREPAIVKPSLRVLVTGDSHTAGVCNEEENLTMLIELALERRYADPAIEAWNAGVGGYMPYNYLGVLESRLDLDPDVFLVVLYGGNDFQDMIVLERYYDRRGPYRTGPLTVQPLLGEKHRRGLGSQELTQAVYFGNNPEDVEPAIRTTEKIVLAMQRIAQEHGILLLVAYLPPPSRGQPQHYHNLFEGACRRLGLSPESVAVSDRIADGLLARMLADGIACVDLRPAFRACDEPLYWMTDLHINLDGHAMVAAEVMKVLPGLLDARRQGK